MPKRVYADERARKSIASVSPAFVSHRPPIARDAFLPFFLSLRPPRALDPRAHDHQHRGSRSRSIDDRESIARPHLALLRASSSVPLASRASRPTALARHRSRARIFTSPRRVPRSPRASSPSSSSPRARAPIRDPRAMGPRADAPPCVRIRIRIDATRREATATGRARRDAKRVVVPWCVAVSVRKVRVVRIKRDFVGRDDGGARDDDAIGAVTEGGTCGWG